MPYSVCGYVLSHALYTSTATLLINGESGKLKRELKEFVQGHLACKDGAD